MFSTATKESARMTKDSAENDIRKNIKGDATNAAERTVDEIAGFANEAGRAVRDFIDTASDRIDETSDEVSDHVRGSPLKSVLIATGVGFLLGMLYRGK